MAKKRSESSDYDRYKAGQAEISRTRSASGRNIGELPEVADPERKLACLDDLRLFAESYFAGRFPLAWGLDHLDLIADLQRVILEGGQVAEAHPRGSGKTTLVEVAALWAVCYGHRRYVMLIGATETAAEMLLDNIKAEVETNDEFAADFPEVCYPVLQLEGINNRANGQTIGDDDERTRIEWTAKCVSLPTIRGAASSGAVIQVAGITGSIRGAARVVDGQKVRPDLVIVDDPQTDDSARSPVQNNTRETILSGAILGLAGPGKKIAAVMPCTVIRPDDMADRILDRRRHPEWAGRRCKLLRSMPTDLKLWEEYGEHLRHGLRQDPPNRAEANQFYAANRERMDSGCVPSWPARFNPDQLSAIQFGMDLFLLNPIQFASEYQNEPVAETGDNRAEPLDGTAAVEKVNRVPRGTVPAECTRLACGIDVQAELIFWLVMGFDERFGGAVVDYGCYPQQPTARFNAADPNPSLSQAFPGQPIEARLYAGLESVAKTVLLRDWPRANGGTLRVERALADAGWGPHTDLVHQWARQSAANQVVVPSKGQYIGAAKTPFSEWKPGPGEKTGLGWRERRQGSKFGRFVLFDANLWKTFCAERWRSGQGSPGAWSVFGAMPTHHSLLADHLSAEFPVRVRANGRTVDEWQSKPGRPDNHWWDCNVLAAVAASYAGLRLDAAGVAGVEVRKIEKQRVKLSDELARKRAARR